MHPYFLGIDMIGGCGLPGYCVSGRLFFGHTGLRSISQTRQQAWYSAPRWRGTERKDTDVHQLVIWAAESLCFFDDSKHPRLRDRRQDERRGQKPAHGQVQQPRRCNRSHGGLISHICAMAQPTGRRSSFGAVGPAREHQCRHPILQTDPPHGTTTPAVKQSYSLSQSKALRTKSSYKKSAITMKKQKDTTATLRNENR